MMTPFEFSRLANIIADKIGIRCVPRDGFGWSVNITGKQINYPKTIAYTDADMGFLLHEIGHIKYSTFGVDFYEKIVKEFIIETGKEVEQIWSLFNALEDGRIENEMKKLYKGTKRFLDEAHSENWKELNSQILFQKIYFPKEFRKEQEKKKWINFCLYVAFYLTESPQSAQKFADLLEIDKDVKYAINKALPFFNKNQVFKCKDSQKLSETVFANILPFYIPLCTDMRKLNKEELKKLKQFFDKLLKDFIKKIEESKRKKESQAKEFQETNEELDLEKQEITGNEYEKIIEEREKKIKKYVKHNDKEKKLEDQMAYNLLDRERILQKVKENLPKVRKGISILKDLAIERYEGNYESGKLQNRKLYKLKCNQTKIFSKKVTQDKSNKELIIAILVDESGSMQDRTIVPSRRAEDACIYSLLLTKALQLCGKKHAIFGFNEEFYIHKDFNQKLNIDNMFRIFTNAWEPTARYNNDGYAILKTVELLKKQPEKNKILIVISDGKPAPSNKYDDYDLREEVKKAEKIATVYGIGVNSSCVKNYYSKPIVVNSPEELGNQITQIFIKHSGKRKR